MKDRGATATLAPNACASAAVPTTVQPITSFCDEEPAHSTKATAMRPVGPAAMARSTSGSDMALA